MSRKKNIIQSSITHQDEETNKDDTVSSSHNFTKKLLDTVHPHLAGGEDTVKIKKTLGIKKKKKTLFKKKSKEYIEECKPDEDLRRHIDHQLQDIYQNDDGTMPDMRHFKKRQQNRFIHALVILLVACIFLGGVAWVGFFILHPQSGFSGDRVSLSITGPNKVVIGQRVTYQIQYQNNQSTPLAQASLEVGYPQGFVFEHASVVSADKIHRIWNIGAIRGHSSGTITIVGRAYGSILKQASFRLSLKYIPSNFNSQFQSVHTYTITYIPPQMQLTMNGPSQAVPGQAEQFTLTMKKQTGMSTTSSFDHYAIVIMPDSQFTLQSSTPSPDQFGGMEWTLSSSSSTLEQLQLVGSFTSSTNSSAATSLHVELVGWKNAAGVALSDGYLLDDIIYPVSLTNSVSGIHVLVNGSRGKLSMQPSHVVHITLQVQNAGTKILTNGQIKLLISAPSTDNLSILYWNKLIDLQNGNIVGNQINSSVRQGVITWTAKNIPELRRINPGQSVLVAVSLPIKTSQIIDLSQFATYDVHITGDISYSINGIQHTLTSNEVVLTINSDTQLKVHDTSTMNEAGQATHTMTWTISNSYHKIKDISISTNLFGNVGVTSSTMQVGVGSVIYNPNSKHLVWNIPDMLTSQSQETFTVPVTLLDTNPTQTDLSSPIILTAIDAVTGQKIKQTVKPIPL